MPMSCIHLTVAFLSLSVCDRMPPPGRPQVSSVRTVDVAPELLEAVVLRAVHIAKVAIVAEARLLIRLASLGRVTRGDGSRALREARPERLRARFEKNMARHKSVDSSNVRARLGCISGGCP
jgi:hypothetical protein